MRTTFSLYALLYVAFLTNVSSAITITLTDPNASFIAADPGPCFPNDWAGCGARAYLTTGSSVNQNSVFTNLGTFHTPAGETVPTGTETFLTGFNNFGDGWTLTNGGNLNNLNMNISMFRANANPFTAGVEIQVDLQTGPGYAGPMLSNLFWIQSLLINYRPVDPGNAMHNVLDDAVFNDISGCTALTGSLATSGAGTYCGPVYPYQYADQRFYDAPTGIYDIDSMRGIALLATVNADSKVVTVYNGGISYGYDIFVVPEPSAFVLVFGGLAAMAFVRRRA